MSSAVLLEASLHIIKTELEVPSWLHALIISFAGTWMVDSRVGVGYLGTGRWGRVTTAKSISEFFWTSGSMLVLAILLHRYQSFTTCLSS